MASSSLGIFAKAGRAMPSDKVPPPVQTGKHKRENNIFQLIANQDRHEL